MPGLRQSMARKGRCYDHTPAESPFHTIEVEGIHAAPGCLTPAQADRRAAGTS